MTAATDNLPDDPALLKAMLSKQQKQIHRLYGQIKDLHEALQLERYRKYGKNSEKSPGQEELFDEADQFDIADENQPQDHSDDNASKKTKRKPKAARKPLPENLPRIKKVIELDAEQRQCFCGCELVEIGETVSEQLDIIPAQVQVLQTIRKKYACKQCEETIKTAPAPEVLLPKAIASANTMAYVITAKYADGLPLYRLSEILKRHQIDLSRQVLSEAVLSVGSKIKVLVEHMQRQLLSGDLIYMDETPVQVLKEPGRSAENKSYMWVQRGGPPNQPIVHFHYDPSRSTGIAAFLLEGFEGALMSDGYEPYRKVAACSGIDHLCCFAHARRKFVEAKNAQPKGKSGRADMALAFIRKLYAVESECRDFTADERLHRRINDSKVILDEFRLWLDETQQKVAPKNTLGKAVNYTLKYWKELSRYIETGHWPIDNNPAENAIRPFVIGRKAWLFSNSQRGATASANLYSLIETAKANQREPYQYLSWMLNRLPETSPENIETLMPWNMPMTKADATGEVA